MKFWIISAAALASASCTTARPETGAITFTGNLEVVKGCQFIDALEDLRQAILHALTDLFPAGALRLVLGLELESSADSVGDAGPYIDLLVEVRDRLRAEKQWALSDLIRDRLAEKGIAVADGATGSTWQKN